MKLKIVKIISLVALSTAVIACEPKSEMKLPDNFATLKTSQYMTKAMSADGVVIACSKREGLAGAKLNFWETTIKQELISRGYVLNKAEDFKTDRGDKGKLLIFNCDTSSGEYLYYVAVLMSGKDVMIGEAGGAQKAVEKYSESIINSFKSIKVRSGI